MAGILSDEQEKKMLDWYDRYQAIALHPPRASDYIGNMDGLRAAQSAYAENPLVPVVAPILDSIKNQHLNGYDPNTGAIKAGSDADNYLQSELLARKKKFQNGMESGKPQDENVMQSAMESIMAGDWGGAIKKLIVSLPYVGRLIASGGVMVKSMFGGDKLSFGDAMGQTTNSEALAAGFKNIGVGPDQLSNSDINGFASSINKGALPDVSGVKLNPGFSANTSVVPTAGDSVPFAPVVNTIPDSAKTALNNSPPASSAIHPVPLGGSQPSAPNVPLVKNNPLAKLPAANGVAGN